MARAATTTDVFNAVAEPRRRQIIDLLARRAPTSGLAVGAIVMALGLSQPAVSKHLGVLREVGLVSVAKQGPHRVYRLQARQLKTMYDWLKNYEQFWTHQLDRIKQRAERKASERSAASNQPQTRKGTA